MRWIHGVAVAAVVGSICASCFWPRQAPVSRGPIHCPDFVLVDQDTSVTPGVLTTIDLDGQPGGSELLFQPGAVDRVSRYRITRVPGAAGFAVQALAGGDTTFPGNSVHIWLAADRCPQNQLDSAKWIGWDKPGNGKWEKAPGADNRRQGNRFHVKVSSFTGFAIAM